MPIGRDIANQAIGDSQKQQAPGKKPDPSKLIGFVLAAAEETLISDMATMIAEGKMQNLDGYVFCLSRVVKHEEAWFCIKEAFRQTNAPIPGKYFTLFAKTPDDKSSSTKPHMTAQ